MKDDLYTVKLGAWTTDAVERGFFGPIDAHGKQAVEFFHDYSLREGAHDAFHALMNYMSAQRFRTPRGLDWLQSIVNIRDANLAIAAMQRYFRLFATMWMEVTGSGE